MGSALSVEERLKLDMLAEARKITCSEVLTVHGSADAVIPVEDGRELARHIRNHTLFIAEGGDHSFRLPAAAAQMMRRIVDYLVAGL
ncbi:hypothetical protein TSOC_007749 [Tetrabaena socialis]|uniref:Peptidase S33 tripeptidyl aminopeptidase-like C-terminal domain-containing protein n=1 Tax=Tetrabaena socialis TaxID=47790 RepID=A0A2J8A086_9CHLO|nr:hypothetical protein TSOC_007749 [Tetrabaena socialis]|eukprot:PNH05937.1 hypothetical protein TSOC_007749 [Tetrabaena socialis]